MHGLGIFFDSDFNGYFDSIHIILDNRIWTFFLMMFLLMFLQVDRDNLRNDVQRLEEMLEPLGRQNLVMFGAEDCVHLTQGRT